MTHTPCQQLSIPHFPEIWGETPALWAHLPGKPELKRLLMKRLHRVISHSKAWSENPFKTSLDWKDFSFKPVSMLLNFQFSNQGSHYQFGLFLKFHTTEVMELLQKLSSTENSAFHLHSCVAAYISACSLTDKSVTKISPKELNI